MSLSFQSAILGHAISSAGALTSQASALMNTAVGALRDGLTFDNPDAWEYTIRENNLTYEPRDEVEGLPVIPDPDIPPPPDFQDNGIASPEWSRVSGEQYPQPQKLPVRYFQGTGYINEPQEPGLRIVTNPTPFFSQPPNDFTPNVSLALLDIDNLRTDLTITLPEINLDTLQVALPDASDAEATGRAVENLLRGGTSNGVPGLTLLTTEAEAFQARVMGALQDDYLTWVSASLADPHRAANPVKAARIGQLAMARLAEIDARHERDLADLTSRSGWTLPAPVQAAVQARARQLAAADDGERADRTTARGLEQARVMYAFTVELYGRYREMLESMRVQEVEAVLDAHAAAVAYARSKVDTLAKLFDLEHFRNYDLQWQRAEGMLQVFAQEQRAEKLRYDAINQQIAIEEQMQTLDRQKVEQYQIEADARRTRLGLIEDQIAAVRGELDLKAQAVEVFDTQLQLFAAKVNADEARLQAMLAEIEGNDLEAQRQLAFIKQYEMEVRMYEQRIDAEAGVGEKQKGANAATMDAFSGMMKAAALPVEYSLLRAQHKLFAHDINAGNFKQDAELALKIQKMDLDFLEQKKRVRRDLLRLVQELSTDATEVELGRKQAIAQTAARGASVLASMGEGAMSAATMVGGGILEEYS